MEQKNLLKFLILVTGLLTAGTPLFAHHGNSAYDEKNRVTIVGTVTEFVWSNPHCQIYLDVKDSKGKIQHWGVETNSPGILIRDGWSKLSLKKGDHVTMVLVVAKNGAPVGYIGGGDSGTKVTLDDGTVFDFSEKAQSFQ